jgi:hypothetical protein
MKGELHTSQVKEDAYHILFRAFSDINVGNVVVSEDGKSGIIVKKFNTRDSCIDSVLREVHLGRTDLLFIGVDDVSNTDMIVYRDSKGRLRCYSYGVNGVYVPIDSK